MRHAAFRRQSSLPKVRAYVHVYPAESFGTFTDLRSAGPANYPCFEIYSGHVSSGENAVTVPRAAPLLQSIYPQFDICRLSRVLAIPFSDTLKIPQYIRTLISTAYVSPRWNIHGFLSRSCCPHNTRRSIFVSPDIFLVLQYNDDFCRSRKLSSF